jgi:hypothetical protein
MPTPFRRPLCLVLFVAVALALPAAGANIAAGSLAVRSVPGGASVTLDGVHQGLTPTGNDALQVGNIPPGAHQLVLSRPGYTDHHHPFWIESAQRSEVRITLVPTTSLAGSISVASSPSGADLFLDGGYRGRTPITVSDIVPGRRELVLDLPGYVRYEDSVEVETGVMTYLDSVLTAAPATGFVAVASSPPGAVVFVDGAYRGVTPLEVPAAAGARRVDLDRAGYADWTTTIQVENGSTVEVEATLQRVASSMSGGISVSSEPAGATVYLDGQYRGVTVANGALELTGVSSGSHLLSVRLDGYDDYRATVQVTPDATVQVRASLARPGGGGVTTTPTLGGERGSIQVNTSPPGARVEVDGVYRGSAPLLVPNVAAGMHIVRFRLDGYVDREQSVDVRTGETERLSANLTPTADAAAGLAPLAALGALVVAGAVVVLAARRR